MEGAVLRLKMVVGSVKRATDGQGNITQEEVSLNAVYGPQGTANEMWSKWTPFAQLSMSISNPAAFGKVQGNLYSWMLRLAKRTASEGKMLTNLLTYRAALLGQLKTLRTAWGASHPELAYRGPADFVLQHGKWFDPAPLAGSFQPGAWKHCYGNSIILCCCDPDLKYIEGFSLGGFTQNSLLAIHHAWNVDANGRLIDTTWPYGFGKAYIGVEFSVERADNCTWHGDASVLDDWKRRWPLLQQRWYGEDYTLQWPASEGLDFARKLASERMRPDKRSSYELLQELNELRRKHNIA